MKYSFVRQVARYGVPSIFSMWVFTLYTMADGFFVGRYVGTTGLAAVSMSMPLINLFFALGVMIGMGGSTLAGIYYGAGLGASGNRMFARSLRLSLLIGACFSALLLWGADDVVAFLGATGELAKSVKAYLIALAPFVPFFMTGYGLEAFTKLDGRPSWPVVCVTLGGTANILLDYWVVARLGWGVTGAGLATGVSQMVSFSLLFSSQVLRPRRVRVTSVSPALKPCMAILRTGFPDFLNEMSVGIVMFLFNRILMIRLGGDGVAVFGVVSYVASLVTLTFVGLGQGVAPLLSINLGRRDVVAVRGLFRVALGASMVGGALFGLLVQLLAPYIVSIFMTSGPVALAVAALRLYGLAFFVTGANLVVAAYFTALRQPRLSAVLTFVRGLGLVALALVVLPRLFGSAGVWLAVPWAEAMGGVLSAWLYHHCGTPMIEPTPLTPMGGESRSQAA